MEPIKTAKQYVDEWQEEAIKLLSQPGELNKNEYIGQFSLEVLLTNFAKDHVKMALEAAAKQANVRTVGKSDGWECWEIEEVDEHSILSAYPLDKII